MPALAYDRGGWVHYSGDDDGLAYLRFEDRNGRLVVADVVLTGGVDTTTLRQLPLGRIEAQVNANAERVRAKLDQPGPDVAGMFRRPRPQRWQVVGDDATALAALDALVDDLAARLNDAPARDRGDDFYRVLADLYTVLAVEGNAPAKVIAQETGAPASTVWRWIREARRRELLPPARAGKRG